MIITSVTKVLYKVEMTDEQAVYLELFLNYLSPSDIDAVCIAGKITPGSSHHASVIEVINDLEKSLAGRKGA